MTLNDTGATHEDLEASVKLITALIDFTNDKILECPAVVRRAFQALDKANNMQLSQGETKRESLIWAGHESDKTRQLYQYFRRLCARSAWSHSKVVCTLKLRYQARTNLDSGWVAGVRARPWEKLSLAGSRKAPLPR